jgi:outer membrane immunogenic protein
MKKFVLASVATLAFATPSFAADFAGPRVGATVGFMDDDFAGTSAFAYGVHAGIDGQVGNIVAGLTAEYQDSDEDAISRELTATVRLGTTVGERALVYGLVGYTNLGVEIPGENETLDGARFGVGLEYSITPKVYATTELRYTDYEQSLNGHQMVAGLGFRF